MENMVQDAYLSFSEKKIGLAYKAKGGKIWEGRKGLGRLGGLT